MIFLQILILLAGFVFLLKGADFFVDGASSIAKALKIPAIVIGLTIVSWGTSLPELAVSVTSALKGIDGIAIGNVVGSNIVNLMLIAGLTATIIPIQVEKSLIVRDLPFSILCAVLLILLSADVYFVKAAENTISRADGIILLLFFAVYMYMIVEFALRNQKESLASEKENVLPPEATEIAEEKKSPLWKCFLLLAVGLAGIILGGQMTIKSATYIAKAAGMSDRLIGLTIIAFGTSLPELITSLIAAKKGQNDIAMGNVVGSNIFNILLILGVAGVINPMKVESASFIDLAVLIICSASVWIMAKPKLKLNRICGAIMILIYAAYTTYIFIK